MNKEQTIEAVNTYRIKIDMFVNSAKILTSSRETSLAVTNLQRAKMWLGKVKGELGTLTPYPESDNPSSPVIEKQAEHTTDTIFNADMQEHLARVKFMRAEIGALEKEMRKTVQDEDDIVEIISGDEDTAPFDIQNYIIFCDQAYIALIEARMWLGMELDRIRDSDKGIKYT